jgi:hypothetical protein
VIAGQLLTQFVAGITSSEVRDRANQHSSTLQLYRARLDRAAASPSVVICECYSSRAIADLNRVKRRRISYLVAMDEQLELRRRAEACRWLAAMPGGEEYSAAWIMLAEDWERRARIIRRAGDRDQKSVARNDLAA